MNQSLLTKKFIETGKISISDLYQFSNISLLRCRARKKFNKHYSKYISEKILREYWWIGFSKPLINSIFKPLELEQCKKK